MRKDQVSITDALGRGFERMKRMLFLPFALEKWLVVGFTAWLAGAGAGGGLGVNWNLPGGFGSRGSGDVSEEMAEAAEEMLGGLDGATLWQRAAEWLAGHPVWVAVGALGCLLAIALGLVWMWLASRGKFMFLDNVVHGRGEVVRPWKRYRRIANSHFFFQLAFIGACFLVVALVLGPIVVALGRGGRPLETPVGCAGLAITISALLLVGLSIAFVQYFLEAFVVPLMYRYDLTVLPAWRRFGGLLRLHPWALLLSGPLLFVLMIAVQLAILMAGLLTCCIGFLLLALPYVGSVLLLPVSVTIRAFTVELLDRIDPGYFPGGEATRASEDVGRGSQPATG